MTSLALNRTQRIVEESLSRKQSALAARDEELKNWFVLLRDKKKRTEAEEKEFKEVGEQFAALLTVDTGLMPYAMVDKNLRLPAERLWDELAEEFGSDTALKRMLIDRIICAWSMSYSYERMFRQMKYREDEEGKSSINYGFENTNFLKEVRRGIESANNQIIRLTETLRNLNTPPIQIKATNAFFAQNQQINQKEPSKDLEKISVPKRRAKTHP
jgi:hypothetical protein